jgi:hypothetical protein
MNRGYSISDYCVIIPDGIHPREALMVLCKTVDTDTNLVELFRDCAKKKQYG